MKRCPIVLYTLVLWGPILLSGCRKNSPALNFSIDLYLHPEAGSSDDILLQTAIRKNLAAEPLTARGVYARVLDGHAALYGSLKTPQAIARAGEIASLTKVTLNDGKTLAVTDVKNLVRQE